VLGATIALSVGAHAPSAAAGTGFFVAATDDTFLFRPGLAAGAGRELGLSAFRVMLGWAPGQTELDKADIGRLNEMVRAVEGLRIVVTVVGAARAAPNDAASRDSYCAYVRDLLVRYPSIKDVVIWNEANLGFFWQPQFKPDRTSASPAAYEALLAHCWDVLHALRPEVNVILTTSPSGNDNPDAASNVSHSPGAFIRKVGAAYRASGRTKRIFDTVGHNPYGMSSAEPPAQRHVAPGHIAQGDLDRLVGALVDGFGGTGQPVPGACAGAGQACPTVWYLEAGYQTVPDAAQQGAYTGRENDARPVPDSTPGSAASLLTQSSQLESGIRLAYCQPHVGAFFNFLLWDEPDLARWQSGVLWADGTKKASFAALRQVVADVAGGKVNCAKLAAEQAIPTLPAGDAFVERLEWPSIKEFSRFNEVWRFALAARVDLTYRASIRRVRGPGAKASGLIASGKLRHGRTRVVQFPRRQLTAGTYRIEVSVTRQHKPKTVTHRSPTFVVR
jgi:hypothetical protein